MISSKRTRFIFCLPLILACASWGAAAFLPPLHHAWRSFKTEHFQYYFYQETEPLARRLAPVAEKIHDRLVDELHMTPAARTHVIIYDDTDLANGMATVLPRSTIHLFATSDYAGGFGRIGDSLVETFTHEYTHILQLGYVADLPQAVNDLVGGLIYPNMFLPAWCTEGLAVAMESEFHRSGRLHSSTWRMFLRADFLADKIMPWPQVTNGVYHWPYGNAWYLYGSYFTQYLFDRYGRDKVAAFYRATGGDLPYLDWAQCFESTFDVELEEAVAAWRQTMSAEFRAEAERITAAGLIEGKPVAKFGGRSGEGTFAPDGRLYYTQRSYTAPTRLMAAGPPYEKSRVITGLQASRPAVSPDGRTLLYGLASPRGENLFSDLYTYDLNKGGATRLSRGLRASDPSWSPDGRQIAFIMNAPPNFSLYRMTVDGAETAAIWRAEGSDQAFAPAWSPKGDRIAFARYRPGDGLRLCLIRPDGTDLAALHEGPPLGEEIDPAWSPDGRYLFFAADPSGVFNIYACDLETRSLWQVTNVLTGAYLPAVSPDGTQLAYTGYGAAGYDQYVLALHRSSWRPDTPAPRVTETGIKPSATAATPYFFAGLPPADTVAKPYSRWETLAPSLGYAMASVNTAGDYDLELALQGSDVLETTAYTLSLKSNALGLGYEAQLNLRLRPFDLILLSGLAYGVNGADHLASDSYRQILLGGGGAGLLSPDDRFDWAATAYQETLTDEETAAAENYIGAKLTAAYGRTAVYSGPVDLVTGYQFGFTTGIEQAPATDATVTWRSAWGRLYLPVADKSRLELAASLGENSRGWARVDLGTDEIQSPEGSLVWDAEASLEFPLLRSESGGAVSPFYLHGLNGLASFRVGQALDPMSETAYSLGLGGSLRLQLGYYLPLDLSLTFIRASQGETYWTLGISL